MDHVLQQNDRQTLGIYILTQQIALEYFGYAWAFLSIFLEVYNTSEKWKNGLEHIKYAADQFEIDTIRLPWIDFSTRSRAKKERAKWYNLYKIIENTRYRKNNLKRAVFIQLFKYDTIVYTIPL
jgi:hypothetical protein